MKEEILKAIRQAVADYMHSEGCSCCRDIDAHKEHEKRLAELLNVQPYEDGSGYDFSVFRTNAAVAVDAAKSAAQLNRTVRPLSLEQTTMKIDAFINGKFITGQANVIGTAPKYKPYINIHGPSGELLVSISRRQMNNLVKAWARSNPSVEPIGATKRPAKSKTSKRANGSR